VYSPLINWALCFAVIALVLVFKTSTNLASAYGIAVTGTLLIDTVLFFVVVRMVWKRPLWLVLLGAFFFGTINLAFLTSNLIKIPSGGWFPLAVAAVIFTVLTTWSRGRKRIESERLEAEGSMPELITEIPELDPPVQIVPGTSTYLNSSGTAPLALQTGVRLNHVIHQNVIIFELDNDSAPHVVPEEQLTVSVLGDTPVRFFRVQARIGFRDSTDIPALLAMASEQGLLPGVDVDHTLYFLSRITIVEGSQTGIAKWRKRLFILLSRNAADPVDYFGLPADRTVTMGTRLSV
jgi:KUP system potassium uptake protein